MLDLCFLFRRHCRRRPAHPAGLWLYFLSASSSTAGVSCWTCIIASIGAGLLNFGPQTLFGGLTPGTLLFKVSWTLLMVRRLFYHLASTLSLAASLRAGLHSPPASALVFQFFRRRRHGRRILLGFLLRRLVVDGQRPLMDFFISREAFLASAISFPRRILSHDIEQRTKAKRPGLKTFGSRHLPYFSLTSTTTTTASLHAGFLFVRLSRWSSSCCCHNRSFVVAIDPSLAGTRMVLLCLPSRYQNYDMLAAAVSLSCRIVTWKLHKQRTMMTLRSGEESGER